MIPSLIIKNSINTLAPHLAFLFNTCIKTGEFSDEFKIEIGSPLFKGKGDSSHGENYRGISVLTPIGKIFEILLSSQISKYFISRKLFSNEQHGFRSNHSRETSLHMIFDEWKGLLTCNKMILSLFIDFKKAFYLANPKILFLKLFHYGFDDNSLKLMNSYFSNRKQKTRINKSFSGYNSLTTDVLQGSIFGLLLFIIFINDLTLESILLADDTSLYNSDSDSNKLIFQIKFKQVREQTDHNNLFINWSKTKIMFLSISTKWLPSEIELCENRIDVVSNFKLLGCTIYIKLT